MKRNWTIFALILLSLLTAAPHPVRPATGVIYQAFNQRFSDVAAKIPELKRIGFTYIQVSPPQKSADLPVWWARYQPLDLDVIAGPLGSEQDLRSLIRQAHDNGLKVLIDVVLNHMADPSFNDGNLYYPQFSPRDFHHPDRRPCIADYGDRMQVTGFWLCDHALNHHLPDLDTSSEYVRSVHKRYLKKLVDLGADGFRFDAMKHIEPDYFADISRAIPADKFIYGEVIGTHIDESRAYTGTMPVTDFHLLGVMLRTFTLGGDMRNLIHPEGFGGALPGPDAVVFARNHDTVMHKGFFGFGDYLDAMLANAYILGRGVGTPFIYRDDASHPIVQAGIRFYNVMAGKRAWVRRAGEVCSPQSACSEENLLFIEREGVGLVIINKAGEWVNAPAARVPFMKPGCYKELSYGFQVEIMPGGDGAPWISAWSSRARGGVEIGPRSALFLKKISSDRCSLDQ